MSIVAHLHQLFNAETCQAYLQTLRWKDRPRQCPRCQSHNVGPWGTWAAHVWVEVLPEVTLQRHLRALLKFSPVESRFCSRKRRGKATFDAPINPCARSASSRSVAVGVLAILGICAALSQSAVAQTRLGLHVTQEELNIWRQRMTDNVNGINGYSFQSIYQNR